MKTEKFNLCCFFHCLIYSKNFDVFFCQSVKICIRSMSRNSPNWNFSQRQPVVWCVIENDRIQKHEKKIRILNSSMCVCAYIRIAHTFLKCEIFFYLFLCSFSSLAAWVRDLLFLLLRFCCCFFSSNLDYAAPHTHTHTHKNLFDWVAIITLTL